MATKKLTPRKQARKPVPLSQPKKRQITLTRVWNAAKAVLARTIHIASYSALYFTAELNMAGAPNQTYAICSLGMVFGAAMFIDYGSLLKRRGEVRGKTYYKIGLALILMNIVNAGSNSEHINGATHDAAAGARNRAGLLAEQLESAKRAVQKNEQDHDALAAKVSDPAATIQAQMDSATKEGRIVWANSGHCVTPKTRDQGAFCTKYGKMAATLADAQARDQLANEHKGLIAERDAIMSRITASGDTPTGSDGFGDSVKEIAPLAGVTISDIAANAITHLKTWAWAAMLEVMSAFLPVVVGGFLAFLFGLEDNAHESAQPPRADKKADRKTVSKPQDGSKKEQDSQDGTNTAQKTAQNSSLQTVLPTDVSTFKDAKLDAKLGSRISGADMYVSYVEFCEENNAEPMSQTAFGLAMTDDAHVEKKKIGGTTYYLNVAFRRGNLRVVK